MAEIRWAAEAEKWLRDIRDYISQDDPAAATRVISGICERVQVFKDFPEIGNLNQKAMFVSCCMVIIGLCI